jgi:HK97 gp10 family phage protein
MVDGVKELTRNLTVTIPKHVMDANRAAMEQGATETVGMMKRLVPVETGELRDSIGWTWGKAPAGSLTIGTVGSTNYATMRITIYAGNEKTRVGQRNQFQLARIIEFGTQIMPAQPYFFPSWRTMRKRVQSRIKRATKQAIRKGA